MRRVARGNLARDVREWREVSRNRRATGSDDDRHDDPVIAVDVADDDIVASSVHSDPARDLVPLVGALHVSVLVRMVDSAIKKGDDMPFRDDLIIASDDGALHIYKISKAQLAQYEVPYKNDSDYDEVVTLLKAGVQVAAVPIECGKMAAHALAAT